MLTIDDVIELLKSVKSRHKYAEIEVYDIAVEHPGVPIHRVFYDEPTNTVNIQIDTRTNG